MKSISLKKQINVKNCSKRNEFQITSHKLLNYFMLVGLILKMCLLYIFQLDFVGHPTVFKE